MGWNLDADALKAYGVTKGAPLQRWNREMLRFARRTGDHLAEVDPERAAEALTRALEMVRAVVSVGGMPAIIGDVDQWRHLWDSEGIPVLDASSVEGLLTDLPPSEERLARLHEWPSMLGMNADAYIEAARIDLRGGRALRSRTSPPEPVEQPDFLFVVGVEVSSALLVETDAIGIPVVSTVRPEEDPTDIFWVIPGDFRDREAASNLSYGVSDYVYQGRKQFEDRLRRYGNVNFVKPRYLSRVQYPGSEWLQERIASPQSSVEVDEVIAAWDSE